MTARAAIACVLLAACRPSPPRVVHAPDPDRVVEPLAPPVTFGPIAHPATVYNEPVPLAAPDPALDEVFAGLVDGARGRGTLDRDPRLDLASAELAALARQGVPVSGGVVDFALRAHGVVEAAALTATGATATELAGKLGDALAFGNVSIGLGGHDPMVAIVVYASPILLGAVPRFVAADASVEIGGTLDPGFHEPHVAITHDDGTIERPAVGVTDAAFIARFDCRGHRGAQWLAVEATGARATPHVLVPIACGAPPPASYQTEPSANLATTAPERRLVALIDRERIAAGVPPLGIDPRAEAAARAYATVMAHDHSIVHLLRGTTPIGRLRDAGLVPSRSAETTMHAESLGHAAELLLDDTSYRANAIDPRPTRIGLALAPDQTGGLFVAIEYVRVEPPLAIAARTRELEARLHAHALRSAPTRALHEAAQWYADQLALGWRDETVRAVFWQTYSLESLHVRDIGAAILGNDTAEAAIDRLPAKSLLTYGIGVTQSARDGAFAGRVTIVILTGTPPANGH